MQKSNHKLDKKYIAIYAIIGSVIFFSILAGFLTTSRTYSFKGKIGNSDNSPHRQSAETDNWSPCGLTAVKCSDEEKVIKIVSFYSEYDSCHYPTAKGCLTASGKIAQVGMVASNLYPFGTKLEIDGKVYTVEDRISKRYNNRIDIFTGYGDTAHQLAIQKGIQRKNVKIIK